MMKTQFTLIAALVLFTAGFAVARAPGSDAMQLIIDLDREIAGLLDVYLEAVPECPVDPDTPLRLWVLDLAWLRADAALSRIDLSLTGVPDNVQDEWSAYLLSGQEYLRVFSEIQRTYHQTAVPDSSICIMLENDLLYVDSMWRIREKELFELFAEEEM